MSNINVYISDCFYGYIIRLIGLAPVPTLNFDFGFFWPDLATFYVSFGSFGLRPPGNPDVLFQVSLSYKIRAF
jgi:hypothetical protein